MKMRRSLFCSLQNLDVRCVYETLIGIPMLPTSLDGYARAQNLSIIGSLVGWPVIPLNGVYL